MFETLLQVLLAGLHLWSDKEKTKYVDRLMSLKKEYREEINKPYDQRNDAVIDDLEFQLRVLSAAFVAGTIKSNSPNQS